MGLATVQPDDMRPMSRNRRDLSHPCVPRDGTGRKASWPRTAAPERVVHRPRPAVLAQALPQVSASQVAGSCAPPGQGAVDKVGRHGRWLLSVRLRSAAMERIRLDTSTRSGTDGHPRRRVIAGVGERRAPQDLVLVLEERHDLLEFPVLSPNRLHVVFPADCVLKLGHPAIEGRDANPQLLRHRRHRAARRENASHRALAKLVRKGRAAGALGGCWRFATSHLSLRARRMSLKTGRAKTGESPQPDG